MNKTLESVAATLVADGKGILAADESVATLSRRFDALGIESTEQSRRAYREMLFTTNGASEFISGAILYDETIRQKSSSGKPLAEVLSSRGIVAGIKVDTGAEPLCRASSRLLLVRIHTIAGPSSPKLLISIVSSTCFPSDEERSCARQVDRRSA
jgi:fructose-bisphosphate aldolase class I